MITSKQNEKVKQVVKLQDKKHRDELGLYVIEGIKLVKEAISLGVQIDCVFCTEKWVESLECTAIRMEVVTEQVFKAMSYEVTPEGVLAVARKPVNQIGKPSGLSLLLDGVSDPANVGAIVRTAAASGYAEIYAVNCGDAYSPKAVRASMGGIFKVKFYACSMDNALESINCPLVVADMKGTRMDSLKIDGKFCLVIGNEAHGVSENVKSKSEYTVSIPMENGMESLNAAVSAGILMYALRN